MTALVGLVVVALITAAGSIYTARALPTLERRVRDHTALLKDMPADMAEPLRALLEEEVRMLVAREHRRRAFLASRRSGRVPRPSRLLAGGVLVGVLAGVGTAAAARGWQTQSANKDLTVLPSWLAIAITLVALGLSARAAWLAWGAVSAAAAEAGDAER